METLQNTENIIKQICRLCLSTGEGNMVPLFNDTGENGLSIYGQSVLCFAEISMEKEDCFPQFMCHKCLHLLKLAIKFKFSCESSEKKLKRLKQNMIETGVSQTDLKEKFCEYFMYREYFPAENSLNRQKNGIPEKSLFIDRDIAHNVKPEHNLTDSHDFDDISQENSTLEQNKASSYMHNIIKTNMDILKPYFSTVNKTTFYKKVVRQRQMEKKQLVEKQTDFTCDVCHKVFASRGSLGCHKERHRRLRFICDSCGKGFPSNAEFQVHQVLSHGTGKYIQCDKCDFKAPRRHDLIEHNRLHTGERPYSCEKCGLTFRRRYIWKKHYIYHTEKTVQCPHCPQKFHRDSAMKAHVNNIHERVYVYRCDKCGVTYTKPVTVRRHLTEKHGVPREMQGKITRIIKGKDLEFPEQ